MKNFSSIKPTVVGGQKATSIKNSNSKWINESLSKPATVNHDKRLYEANDLAPSNTSSGENPGGLVGAVWSKKMIGEFCTHTGTTASGSWEGVRAQAVGDSTSSIFGNIESMHANQPHTLSRFGMAFDLANSGLRSNLHEIHKARITFVSNTNSEVFGWTKQAAGSTAYVSSGAYIVNGFINDTSITASSAYNDPYAYSPSFQEAVTGLVGLPGATESGKSALTWGVNPNGVSDTNTIYSMELNSDGILNLFGTGYDLASYAVQFWMVTPQDKTNTRLEWDRHYSQMGAMSASEGSSDGEVWLEVLYRVKNAPFQPIS